MHEIVSVDFRLGPHLASGELADENSLPDWAKALDYDSLKIAMKNYVEQIATALKGKIHYYHLWGEANVFSGNNDWPMDRIIDIIKMEVTTIKSIDPAAKTCVDLQNVTPETLEQYKKTGKSIWTTEDFVNKLLTAGVPFDTIGLETHYGSGSQGLAGGVDSLYKRLIELQSFGKPIYIWEDGAASYIEPQYLAARGIDFWLYLWHGTPTEEKQAEKMVADAIVYLGNPSVAGVKYLILSDWPDFALGSLRFDGVVYVNGRKKQAFYALQNLWGNLTVYTTIQSTDGVAAFRGLAGNYTVSAAGYWPITISVAEGAASSFNLRLVPMRLVLLTSTTTMSSPAVTSTQSAATSTHGEEPWQAMTAANALLTTPIGNTLLIAVALAIAITAAIVVRPKIKRSLS